MTEIFHGRLREYTAPELRDVRGQLREIMERLAADFIDLTEAEELWPGLSDPVSDIKFKLDDLHGDVRAAIGEITEELGHREHYTISGRAAAE